jgi:hypothetical protein
MVYECKISKPTHPNVLDLDHWCLVLTAIDMLIVLARMFNCMPSASIPQSYITRFNFIHEIIHYYISLSRG